MPEKKEAEIAVLTDKGKRRIINEDCYSVINKENLAIVSDGAGGHKEGNFASRLIVDTIEDIYYSEKTLINSKLLKNIPKNLSSFAMKLIVAIRVANFRLFKTNESHKDKSQLFKNKMIAAFCALAINNGLTYIANVGDSRVYRLRNNELKTMTADHIAFNKIKKNGKTYCREFLTRALGINEGVRIDILIEKALKNDIYLLCTDGLYKMLSEHEIVESISKNRDNLAEAARNLIELSNKKGGEDNITVALFKFIGNENRKYNNNRLFFTVEPQKGKSANKALLKTIKKIYA